MSARLSSASGRACALVVAALTAACTTRPQHVGAPCSTGCAGGLQCVLLEESIFQCMAPCEDADAPCDDGLRCQYREGRGPVCFLGGSLVAGDACNEREGPECGARLSCGLGRRCVPVCYPWATPEVPCATGEVCHGQLCEVSCADESACAADQACLDGMCWSVERAERAADCDGDGVADCPLGTVCRAGECV